MIPAKPVVFLHAFPFSARMWAPQLEAVRGRFSAHAVNLPGFGGEPATAATLAQFAESVLEELDVLGIERAVFVGLSMGGYVAFRLFDLAPERFSGLVLADTRAGADAPEGKEKRTALAERVRREGAKALLPDFLNAVLGETTRKTRPELVRNVEAMILEADPEGVAKALLAMRDRPDSFELLSRMNFPVLLLFGEEDALTPPEEGLRMLEKLPQGRMLTVPRTGHMANLEAPAAFNTALLGLLSEVYP